ncbi:MAG: DUF7482 domain-containing protein [Aggregatilineales bacterium]
MTRKLSRRNFIRNLSVGAGAAMLANMGLPAVLAADNRLRLQNAGSKFDMFQMQMSPDVELLVGDVLGFQLQSSAWEGAFGSVTFQLHKAWHNGEDAYYIRTDASDEGFATENKLVYVPLLNAARAAEGATAPLYTFTNGTDDQFPVISTTPAQENYTSAWRVTSVTFSGDTTTLTSEADILAAADAGDATVEDSGVIVNFPVVKWEGGELQEDTEKLEYLGTGPLISPVDTDAMVVVFKLHECYPGSRYIITDTSAAPMAPMMAIAPSAPTQALMDVGATDEIWVFGNGIPGSGVMGFQPAIFDNAAGDPVWSPFWNHFTAVWEDESTARILHSSDELQAAIDAGEITIFNGTPATDPMGFVVNCPVPIKAANTFHGGDDMM